MEKNRIQLLKDYFYFLLQSTNAHGLHSPFIYSLVTKCFYDKKIYADYQILKQYQAELAKDRREILVNDLGAGSKKFRSEKRKINKISKIAGSDSAEMKLLYRLVKYFKPKQILELGTSLGKATMSMALANPETKIDTVEGSESILNISKSYFNRFKLENINLILSDFDTYLDEISQLNQQFDFVFMDGNHRYEPSMRYFEKILRHVHNDTVLILDDIYWSDEMKNAWAEIKNHRQVRQTIDTFHWGFVFFRKEQFKERFIVRR